MIRNRLKILGVCLALCSAGTAMSDVIIDSEHRAAGGIYTGLRLLDEVPANLRPARLRAAGFHGSCAAPAQRGLYAGRGDRAAPGC